MATERKGRKYEVQEIIHLFASKRGSDRVPRLQLDGDMVRDDSLRLVTFKTKGITCSYCGVRGSFFVKERTHGKKGPNPGDPYHVNLYAVKDGREILMTHDHVIPLSKGGSDTIENSVTSCLPCNTKKGNSLPSLETVLERILKETGACLFEIGTPDDESRAKGKPEWEVSGWRNGRWTRFGPTIVEAALELEKVLKEETERDRESR